MMASGQETPSEGCKGSRCARPRSGARNSVFSMVAVCCFPSAIAWNWIGSRMAESQNDTLVWDTNAISRDSSL